MAGQRYRTITTESADAYVMEEGRHDGLKNRWHDSRVGSIPTMRTKSGPVIDTMCRLPVRFILSRKALQIGRFCKIAGAFEAPSEGKNEPLFSFMDLL